MQHFDQRFVCLSNIGFGVGVVNVQNFERALFSRGQLAPAARFVAPRVLSAVIAQNLVGVFDAQSGPGARLGIAHRFGGALPHFILGLLCVDLGLRQHQSRLRAKARRGQNERSARWAAAAQKQSSELMEGGDFRVAEGAEAAPKRSSNLKDSTIDGIGSPKTVDSSSKKEELFHQSRLPGNSGGWQNFRVAEGAKAAPKRSSNPTMDETGESTRCDTAESLLEQKQKNPSGGMEQRMILNKRF